ncbi:MAG TPA: hypothetical protein VMX54_20600 [Vicinamibacteria bacterium]|nr:hypothetical protein [Vicinamibacteria bacterium]
MRLLLLAPAIAVASLGPGLLLVARLRWHPLERLCGAVGASLVIVYLVGFAGYAAGTPGVASAWALSGACLLATLAALPDLRRLLRVREVRQHVGLAFLLLCWILLLTATVRVYAGGGWSGDWLEHYERARFFLERGAASGRFLNHTYELPARPPLVNVVVGHFLAQSSRSFAAYQLTAAFLNVLVFLPGALVARVLGARRPAVSVLAALLALNPSFVQNASYPWTKLPSAFFVLLGLALYVRGRRTRATSRLVGSALALAAAVLAHYAAAPFAIAVGLHALVTLPRASRGRALVQLPAMALAGAALLATWVGWSVAELGLRSTFASNGLVTDAPPGVLDNARKVGVNVLTTLVPFPLRLSPRSWTDLPAGPGYLHDFLFALYQHDLVFAIGLVAGPAAAWLFWRAVRRQRRQPGRAGWSRQNRSERSFWLWLVAFAGLLGIATTAGVDPFGVAHIVAQPLTLLGLVQVAAAWAGPLRLAPSAAAGGLSRSWRLALVAGSAVDFCAGILVHFVAQTTGPDSWVVAGVPRRALRPLVSAAAGQSAFLNGVAKLTRGLVYLGDYTAAVTPLLLLLACAGSAAVLVWLARSARRPDDALC